MVVRVAIVAVKINKYDSLWACACGSTIQHAKRMCRFLSSVARQAVPCFSILFQKAWISQNFYWIWNIYFYLPYMHWNISYSMKNSARYYHILYIYFITCILIFHTCIEIFLILWLIQLDTVIYFICTLIHIFWFSIHALKYTYFLFYD